MKTASRAGILACVTLMAVLAVLALGARAQESMRDAVATFAFDLHEGMKRANLTPAQKEQIRDDLRSLREAHQSGNRRQALRAMMNFHRLLDSGAFQPEDQQRISQDLESLRQAKKEMGGGTGMGGMR
jgi:Spy/CpxP family protein refolding chaperone